jgi:hypothetical protein
MGFEVYKGDIPTSARPGRGVSGRTQEVLDALTQSAVTNQPVQFTWLLADVDEGNREKSRIRGIAWQHGFSCSLWVKEGKIILKSQVKADGEDTVAEEMVTAAREASHAAEVLQAAASEKLGTISAPPARKTARKTAAKEAA